MEASGPNADQIRYWNDIAGAKWLALQDQLDAQAAAFAHEAMERLHVASGERVLDVGCGCGSTTLELAHRVGESGHVTGIDISSVMLARAREVARARSVTNIDFLDADAQSHDFGTSRFDLSFSRFGVMFFTDPVAAFANLRRTLAPNGRIGFVCWQTLDRNPCMKVPLDAVAPHIAIKRPPPGAPGPFAFGDRDRVQSILEQAGFEDIHISPMEQPMIIGGLKDLDEASEFSMQLGPAGASIREAPPESLPIVRAAIRAALAPFHTSEGVRLDAALWFVRALPGNKR